MPEHQQMETSSDGGSPLPAGKQGTCRAAGAETAAGREEESAKAPGEGTVLTPSTALLWVCASPCNAPGLFCSWQQGENGMYAPRVSLGDKLPSGGRS